MVRKFRLSILLASWCLGPLAAAAATVVPAPPSIEAEAYILRDYHSGRVLVESNADKPMEPASLTKMMTAYAVFAEIEEGNIGLDDRVLVSEKAWRMPGSRMFIEVDTEVTVEALLKGVIIQSGNDASVALAEYVAGNEETFADLMNRYAEQLGMMSTHFVNATGLPHPEHYTTVRDMTTMAAALVRDYPEYYPWHAIREFEYNSISQFNRNRLLWRDESVDGVKTGHTESAGFCLVASAEQDGMRLISAVMGSKSENARIEQSQALLRYGFRFFETRRLYEANEKVTEARVWQGAADEVALGVTDDLYVTVPRGKGDDLEAESVFDERLVAPLAAGEPRGTLSVSLAGQRIAERPLVTLQDVARGSLWKQATDYVRMWLE